VCCLFLRILALTQNKHIQAYNYIKISLILHPRILKTSLLASVKLKLKTTQTLVDGSHPIILQVLKDGQKAIVSIGVRCNVEDWSVKLNLPKNRRLSLICQKKLLEMEELLYEGIENEWTAKKIAAVYTGKDTKELMFFTYYKTIDFEGKIGVSTSLLDDTKIKKFKRFLGNKDISFNDVTFELLKSYKKSLVDEGLKSATRYLSIIRQVYNYAIENDDYVSKKNPFKSSLFKKKITSTTINRNLNVDQTKRLIQLEQTTQKWKVTYKTMALDFWKFCFYMRGINFVELALMTPKDVETDYFTFTRTKLKTRTSDKQIIKIFPEAREIINKYCDPEQDYLFPVLENGFNKEENIRSYKTYSYKTSTINANLRRIGKELGVDFNLTTMSARYTFVNLAKQNEVPYLYLQELIGHKHNTTTDIYLDVFPQNKIDEYHRKVIDAVL
jgi:site-specific recombinase XerD